MATYLYAGSVASSNSVLLTCGTVRFLYDGVTALYVADGTDDDTNDDTDDGN
jgi:hypothetical protein